MKTREAFRAWVARVVAGVVAGSIVFAPAFAYAQKVKPTGAAAASSASSSPADKPLDKQQLADAKKHYGDGVTKFAANDFEGALQDFKAADDVKQTPQTARYIGVCLDKLERFPEAIQFYERFLGNVPPKLAAQGDEIKARVAAIQQLPGKIHASSDPTGASFAADGKAQPNPTPAVVELAPGHHAFHFTSPGRDAVDKDVEVTFGAKQEVSVTLPAKAAPPPPVAPIAAANPPPAEPPSGTPPPPPPPPAHNNTAAFITGGAAIIAVGVGTAFGVMALNDSSNFKANPTTSTADSGENHALIADMAFGVAVTLGVTSFVLFLSHDDSPPPVAAAQVTRKSNEASAKKRAFTIIPSPIVTPHGGGAGALIEAPKHRSLVGRISLSRAWEDWDDATDSRFPAVRDARRRARHDDGL